MPYSLKGNCVYKGEEKLKCYENHDDALAYFRALKLNVENSIHEFSMLISKSSLFEGEMRWSAVNSDTDWDLYGERMSLELYKSMISKIKSNAPPPSAFAELVTSDYWKGGMPYLSIAHYSDGNGKAVPGDVRELFIDGNQLKAKGTLHDSPLGRAVWKSLKEDEVNYKNNLDTDRIRISIAFLDLAHRHGEDGQTFRRNSFTDMCPDCIRGLGEKIYLDGYLVHLALTRVPVNPRTIMKVEDVMAKKSQIKTKKEDAESILGDVALANEVEKSALEMKSEVLVEMSETTPDEIAEPTVENQEVISEPEVVEETLSVTKSQLENLVSSLVEQAMSKKDMKDDMEDEEGGDSEDYHSKDKMKKKSDTVSEPQVAKSALEISMEKLYNAVNVAISKAGSAEEKLQEIQPALEYVGQEIMATVKSSVGAPPTPQAPQDSAVLEAIQSLASKVTEMGTEIATLKAQSTNIPVQDNRVPAPRSINPAVVKSVIPTQEANPNSVKSIVRRSVGLG